MNVLVNSVNSKGFLLLIAIKPGGDLSSRWSCSSSYRVLIDFPVSQSLVNRHYLTVKEVKTRRVR